MINVYETERLFLKISDVALEQYVLDYYIRNRDFLKEWEALKDEKFYTLKFQREKLAEDMKDFSEGRSLRMWLFKKDDPARIIGCVSFNNIVRGAFWSCHMGYKADSAEAGKGYITEAAKKGIDIMFKEYKLHRIEANIMPKNNASMRVVQKLGFHEEGVAQKYLNINGRWEDHIHMVLFNDEV